MLTVKHINTDGTETLLEAERVEKVQTGDRFSDGIFLDREPRPMLTPSLATEEASLVPRSFRHVIHFAEARSSDDTVPMVYVMNRFGATVATYRL
jgi:hypothetical protein